ncbi:MAG: single-stranded-DNA-specific exonuclease RecJ [Chloroflexi bacterium]|nr:MAG: single-stranded-DNA-specific exonuclease RecJ [Chloroflexota bacterium]MBL1196194.1 single-stranded-DNA-specific exonuclease RecJ [Chloroflexota bacterium]NOH13487.1 single-stranded-DNA-specific exonuclease RecJ [Chloroflexota bacterium]
MSSLEKRWQIAASITPEADKNLEAFPPLLRQLLFNRGYATHQAATDFLNAAVPEGNDAFDMLGVQEAAERISHAIDKGERIVIYGDYDTDGVTASVLMVQTLKALGADVEAYIPNRFDEGYGLNKEALSRLKEENADLIITVDCGIRALEEAQHAKELGLQLIISDHHTPGPKLPWATALINPKQADDTYPEKNLAGVGTAFKLASGVIKQRNADFDRGALLDLVALGTVADMVPLTGENRAMVRHGLQRMRQPRRQGLQALMGIAGVEPKSVTAMHIGFMLGPRLNAAGRLDTALDALELLLSDDVFVAGSLAQKLDNYNRERQKITRDMQSIAEEISGAEDPDKFLLFAAHKDFNPGVVGLTASRLVEQYYRPAIVAEQGEEFTRASCRSINEFNITEALQECADLLDHFGGHAAAAGFTAKNENATALIERLEALAKDQLETVDLRPVLHADKEVALDELSFGLLDQLEMLEPTGYANPAPRFVSRNVQVQGSRAVGKESTHLKLTLTDGTISHDAIAFRQGHWVEHMPSHLDVLYAFERNDFRGKRQLQLNIQDLKASE